MAMDKSRTAMVRDFTVEWVRFLVWGEGGGETVPFFAIFSFWKKKKKTYSPIYFL